MTDIPTCTRRPICEAMRRDLSDYGSRLGIVEPLFLGALNTLTELDAILADLRSRKDYVTADRLRGVMQIIRQSGQYAFPGRCP